MKHEEIYDKHMDRTKAKGTKKKFKESRDFEKRQARVSFKHYVREIEEQLLEDDLEADDQAA